MEHGADTSFAIDGSWLEVRSPRAPPTPHPHHPCMTIIRHDSISQSGRAFDLRVCCFCRNAASPHRAGNGRGLIFSPTRPPRKDRRDRGYQDTDRKGVLRRRQRRSVEPGGLQDGGIGSPAHLLGGCVGARTLSNPRATSQRAGTGGGWFWGEEPVQVGSSQRTPAPREPAHTSSPDAPWP